MFRFGFMIDKLIQQQPSLLKLSNVKIDIIFCKQLNDFIYLTTLTQGQEDQFLIRA